METIKSYQAGDFIFKQGEGGNALFVIREGQVEIVKETSKGEVFLTMQNPGKVVSLLSFFNSGSRLASARARTSVEGLMIEKEAGQDPLTNLPGWVQLVLKEFTLRLGYGREEINEIFNVFKNLGMVKVELHPDSGLEMLAASNIPRLKWHSEFIRSAKSGRNRRLIQTEIPFRFRKVIFALREYAQKRGGNLQETNSVDYALLFNDFETLTKVKPDPQAFEFATAAGLLELKKASNKVTISFNPTMLVRTLIATNVAKRLRSDPRISDDDEQAT